MSDHNIETTKFHSYHCICTTLVLVTTYDLDHVSKRVKPALDGAFILPITPQAGPSQSTLHNLVQDRKPMIVRREDGFEKRLPLRCNRCKLIIGYQLDQVHFQGSDTRSNEIVYVLPGSLVSTKEMQAGRTPEVPAWA